MFGWAEWFFIDNIKLAGRVGVSERALIDIRHRLQQRGLIDFIPGKKGKPTKYKLIQLYKNTEDTSVNTSVQSSVNTSVKSSVQTSANINNKRKLKLISNLDSLIGAFADGNEEMIQALNDFVDMRNKIKKPLTDRAMQMVLKKLDGFAETAAEKIEILNQSTMKCWQDIYELKNKGGADSAKPILKASTKSRNQDPDYSEYN